MPPFSARLLAVDSFIDDNWVVYEIRHYLTRDEKDVYEEWHTRLRDIKARIAIDRRINRIELGNFGDHKFCRDGVWELRIDVGQGYRVYYASREHRLSCSSAEGTNEHKRPTSDMPVPAGKTGKAERIEGGTNS